MREPDLVQGQVHLLPWNQCSHSRFPPQRLCSWSVQTSWSPSFSYYLHCKFRYCNLRLSKAFVLKNQSARIQSYTDHTVAYIAGVYGIFPPKLISKCIFVTIPPSGFEKEYNHCGPTSNHLTFMVSKIVQPFDKEVTHSCRSFIYYDSYHL